VGKQFEKATERKAQVEDVSEMGGTEMETKRPERRKDLVEQEFT
jgi:hypothetical protein